MAEIGQTRRIDKSRRSRHVRFAPKATVADQNVIHRYVPCVDGSELARLFFTFAGWSVADVSNFIQTRLGPFR
jgi:hypothetical protein